MRFLKLISLLFLILTPEIGLSQGSSLTGFEPQPISLRAYETGTFVVPNESKPSPIAHVTQFTPEGLYISVGTERGLIGLSLTESANGLLLLDVDPGIVLHNQINIALLKLAKNREDYVNLRNIANHDDWVEKVKANRNLSSFERELLLKSKNYYFWTRSARHKMWRSYYDYDPNDLEKAKMHTSDFNKNYYLHQDEHFEKVQKLAKEGRIEALALDFNNKRSVDTLVDSLKSKGEKLAVIDISNAWWDRYMSKSALNHLSHKFGEIAQNSSQILVTDVHNYLGIEFGYFRDKTNWGEIFGHVDGLNHQIAQDFKYGGNILFSPDLEVDFKPMEKINLTPKNTGTASKDCKGKLIQLFKSLFN